LATDDGGRVLQQEILGVWGLLAQIYLGRAGLGRNSRLPSVDGRVLYLGVVGG
jgi:hypothetical protein